MTDQLTALLNRIYFDPSNAGGYVGAERLRARKLNNYNQLIISTNSV